MSDEKHQEIDYDSSNGCVRSFNRTFCFWGQRKTPYDKEGNVKGKTAPLWANPAKKFFMWMCIISLIMCILFIAAYVIVNYYNNTIKDNNSDDDKCVINTKKKFKIVFVIFGTIILFLNCKKFLYLFF
jgi:magnesium-transporting ATPase (P-type)